MGLKDKILAEKDLVQESVPTPEWPTADGQLQVRTMTGTERDEFDAWQFQRQKNGKPDNIRGVKTRLLVLCLIDNEGKRVFDSDDDALLIEKSACPINRLSDVALRLNGYTEADVEDLVKNYSSGQSDDSGST